VSQPRRIRGRVATDLHLHLHLRRHGIDTIILAGRTALGCVEGTGRYATELGYSVTLAKDATAAFSMDLPRAATELTGPLYAESVQSTDEILSRLR
jgi:nicotinamidase-related amidase